MAIPTPTKGQEATLEKVK